MHMTTSSGPSPWMKQPISPRYLMTPTRFPLLFHKISHAFRLFPPFLPCHNRPKAVKRPLPQQLCRQPPLPEPRRRPGTVRHVLGARLTAAERPQRLGAEGRQAGQARQARRGHSDLAQVPCRQAPHVACGGSGAAQGLTPLGSRWV